ncbi:MAG: L-threonylcarbamoyladenylate synthase [Methanotrichaceae archaeon]
MISKAARLIICGGTVVYPTETVYGIGASAFNDDAVMKVFQIKRRPLSMPLSLAVSSFSMLKRIAELDEFDLALLEELLPGPVTFLVKKKTNLPDIATAGSSLVGIRYPNHQMALALIERTGPIISTSANVTGSPPPASIKYLDPKIAEEVDLVLDGGRCRFSQPSTLVDLKHKRIIREGAGIDLVKRLIR